MNIAVLHPQCRIKGGAIKMALLSAQSLQKQGHRVMLYTLEHDPDCFPELQEGLTIVTARTTQSIQNTKYKVQNGEERQNTQYKIHSEGMVGSGKQSTKSPTVDTVDTPRSFWQIFSTVFPRISSSIGIAWDIRHVDIVIAHNPPMQIVGALAKVFSVFSRYHQRLAVIWWHHHVPWYYQPKKIQKTKYRIQNGGIATGKHTNIALALLEGVFHLFSAKTWKSYFERHWIIPHIKYMVATSYYAAYCLEQYCGRKATVIHPVISPSFQPSPDTSGREVESTSDGSLCTFDDKSTKIIQGTKTRYEPISSGDGDASRSNSLSPKNPSLNIQEGRKDIFTRPIALFSHGRLEPGKGFDMLVKVWKELQVIQKTKDKVQNGEQIQNTKYKVQNGEQIQNTKDKVQNDGIKLVIAGDGSLKSWLIEQGATVIPYYEGLLEQIQNTKYTIQNGESIQNTKYKVQSEGSEKVQQIQNTKYKVQSEGIVDSDSKIETQNSQLPPEMTQSDTLAIYLSTIDAFGMCPLEAQIAGLPTIIFDKGGARETQLLDSFGQPMAQLVHTETEIIEAITYFIQQKSLHKSMSNVNFCHHTEYFSPSRLDADIRSLIDSVR